jgi:tetratricopeptide (TPR) repeat protein
MLPMYLARGVLEGVFLGTGRLDLDVPQERFRIFCAVRMLAAVFSCLSLGLVYAIGRRCFNWQAGCLGTFFVALAPVAVQQAHFYTVDSVFTFLVLAVFYVVLRVLETPQRWIYVLGGILVGATGAVRLNGLLLGIVLLAAHLLQDDQTAEGSGVQRWRRRLLQADLWLAGLMAVLVVVLLQPFLVVAPELLQRADFTDDFAFSVKVARGEILRLWSLVDVHTVPYLHYWSDLWPQAVGWPLTGAFILGVGWALKRRRPSDLLILLWVAIYFVPVGGLFTKHVRYLLPLLPFLGLLAADLCWEMCRLRQVRWRAAGIALVLGLVVYTGCYGIAFARIYSIEDSRIQAGRWIEEQVPKGSVVGVERGGFSMHTLVSQERLQPQFLGMSVIFGSRGNLSCEATRQFLQGTMQYLDYIALVDVNRYRQFTAAPDLYPAAASFYQKLVEGELGFEQVQRFKNYPALAGLEFGDDGAEPSFLGYDHPAVLVFKRRDSFAEDWTRWRGELEENPGCVDRAARAAATAFQAGDLPRALGLLQILRQDYPDNRFAALLEALIHHRQGSDELEREAQKRYLEAFSDPSLTAYLIPWASGRSLVDLGLHELALKVLLLGIQLPAGAADRLPMARSYISLADHLHGRGEMQYALEVYRLSVQIQALPEACNVLASMAYEAGQRDEALAWWARSLEVDDTQAAVYKSAGRAAYELQDYPQALQYLERAVRLHPGSAPQKRIKEYNMLAETAQLTGQFEQAVALWARSLKLYDAQAQVHAQLGQVAAGELRDYGRALRHLQRAVELDPGLAEDVESWIQVARSGDRGQ